MKILLKLLFIAAIYLLSIGAIGWLLIKSYDLFLTNINENVNIQTTLLHSQINDIKNLAATNPASLKDIQEYDARHNTHYYNRVSQQPMNYYDVSASAINPSQISSKETIKISLDGLISTNEQKISDINDSNKGFWSELPKLSTLLLGGLAIFLTSLITNFGNFCSGLINSFRRWICSENLNAPE